MWHQWIRKHFRRLASGAKLYAPDWLPHPSRAGFNRLAIAEPAGQVADWSMSLKDGSRIHIHEKPNGRMLVHRDKYDPERGPIEAALHIATETKVGAVVGVVGVAALGTWLLSKLFED